jgi:lysophospholipase L1-like esterase
LSNGELDGISPKLVVLMTGTNNLWRDTPEDITKGVSTIIETIHSITPDAKVLVLGVLPRDDRESQPGFEKKIKDVNELLAKLDDHDHVRYFSFADKYLDQEGKLAKGFLADGFHPTPRGYEVWATQVKPVIDDLLK